MKLLSVLLCVMAAEGQPTFDQVVEEGLQAYSEGRFEEAAGRFIAAYELSAEPELIFNAARSFEKALKPQEAIEYYERFIGLQGTTAELRNRALSSLRSLRAEVQARQAPSASSAPPAASVQAAPPARRSVNRTPEILLLSVGGASLIAGGVFGGLALSAENDFEEADMTDPDRIGFANDARDRALVADVLLGVGAASTVTGVLLLIFRGRGKSEAKEASGPSLDFDGQRLVLSGRF
ncbi:MAG: hypothetical protein ACFB9M_12035 [Myxococcota bacterium]